MITGFDKRGNNLGPIDFIEVQWNRKWSTCGTFAIYMAAASFDSAVKYVTNDGRPETGVVKKIQKEETPEGVFITLEGFFLNNVANGGGCHKPRNIDSDDSSSIDELVMYLSCALSGFNENGNFISGWCGSPTYKFAIDERSQLPDDLAMAIERGKPAAEALYELLNNTGYSFDCEPIYAPIEVDEEQYPILGLNFIFKKGNDKKDIVYFGDTFKNISSLKYTLDESAIKNYYVVLQKVESLDGWESKGFNTFTEKIDGETAYYISARFNFVNGSKISDMGYATNGATLEAQIDEVDIVPANATKIKRLMEKAAKLEMLNNYKVETIEATVLQEKFFYLQDYDLGDVCTVYIDELQKMYSARIEEVREVHAANKVEIEVVLGTPTQRMWKAVII